MDGHKVLTGHFFPVIEKAKENKVSKYSTDK